MRPAVRNYLSYIQGKNSSMLGRFVVDLNRLSSLREIADSSICDMRLSIITPPTTQWTNLPDIIEGLSVDSIEIKADRPSEIEHINKLIPSGIVRYFEVPFSSAEPEMLNAIAATGTRIKLRTG